jgi:hypothetical protein
MLGIEVSQATVAKHRVRRCNSPSQTPRTFLENHVKQLVPADFFVVPTVSFRMLYVFVVVCLLNSMRQQTQADNAGAGVPIVRISCSFALQLAGACT